MAPLTYWAIICHMTYGDEIRRKLIHLGSAAFPLAYWATDRQFMLRVLVPLAAVAIVAETLRRLSPGFRAFIDRWLGRVLRRTEAHTFTGATYVTVANLLAIVLFEKPIAITVLLFLSVSDALASLVGIRFGTVRFLGKSLAGSMAFFVSGAAIALYVLRATPLVGLAGALIGTVVEALSLKIGAHKLDDNLSIPLITGAAMTGLQAALT
ncbi:MAG: diacylglycerol/polyprenol kinase family protein [Phycisphaerae bacterium]